MTATTNEKGTEENKDVDNKEEIGYYPCPVCNYMLSSEDEICPVCGLKLK